MAVSREPSGCDPDLLPHRLTELDLDRRPSDHYALYDGAQVNSGFSGARRRSFRRSGKVGWRAGVIGAALTALRSDRKLTIGTGQGCSHRFANFSFDLHRRHTSDGPRILLAALQNRLRDIVAPSASALGRVAWTHSVAAIVKELAGKEGVGV